MRYGKPARENALSLCLNLVKATHPKTKALTVGTMSRKVTHMGNW